MTKKGAGKEKGPKHGVYNGWKAGSDNPTLLVGRTCLPMKNETLKVAFGGGRGVAPSSLVHTNGVTVPPDPSRHMGKTLCT